MSDGATTILFFPQTYSVRVFGDPDLISSHYPGKLASLRRNKFTQPKDLAVVFSHVELGNYLHQLTARRGEDEPPHHDARDRARPCPHHDPDDTLSVCGALWEVLLAVGDRVEREARSSAESQEKYEFDLRALVPEVISKFPKQARIILDAVMKQQIQYATEKELVNLVTGLVGRQLLKTRQPPWRIFQFYQRAMYDAGLMKYPGMRKRGHEGGEDGEESAGAIG